MIGSSIKNKKIIILDDVLTSGTSINYAVKITEREKAQISSIFVLLDRKEIINNYIKIKNSNQDEKKYKVNSIITIDDLISYLLKDKNLKKYTYKLIEYQKKYSSYF